MSRYLWGWVLRGLGLLLLPPWVGWPVPPMLGSTLTPSLPREQVESETALQVCFLGCPFHCLLLSPSGHLTPPLNWLEEPPYPGLSKKSNFPLPLPAPGLSRG